MMTASVKRAFTTRLRRLGVGDPVNRLDDLAPHDYGQLVIAGYIDDPAADGVETAAAGGKKSRSAK